MVFIKGKILFYTHTFFINFFVYTKTFFYSKYSKRFFLFTYTKINKNSTITKFDFTFLKKYVIIIMKIKNERRYIDLLKFIIYNTENA